ncbi:MAG: NAD+ synthase [Phycisphaerales bacterium]|jgi:NAD+ synthase (glutamine-hydrolysing)|nr:NAD+ synthase [Phycisphaerales bacterium]
MKLALAQINPTIGDIKGNAALVLDAALKCQNADLLVCPELCLTGYPPKDLLMHEGFLDEALAQAKSLAESLARQLPQEFAAVVGLPLSCDSGPGITNSLVVLRAGAIIARYDKRLLPTYDVFDEDRYFVPGSRACVVDVGPAGRTSRVGLSICEDLWRGEDAGFSSRYLDAPDPVADLIRSGARVIINPSASPFVLGKSARHRDILRRHATNHRVHVASVNQVGGNDDLVFDGHSCVIDPAGSLVAAARGFESELLVIDLDTCAAPTASPSTHAMPVTDPALGAPEELAFHALRRGVADYCRKTGFKSVLLGLSGGIDSALTACIASAALGPANVLGVGLPGPFSSDHSVEDARRLAANLGVRFEIVQINSAFEAMRPPLDHAFRAINQPSLGASLPDLAEENLQSRLRGVVLMALSNRSGSLVLTTGNKSELAVGYCTLYGDMNGGLAVLSDVSKQLVYRLSRFINDNFAKLGFTTPPIPERSITKPPSAELRPDQTDQDSLPPYDVLDEIIDRYVERRQHPARIVREAGFDAALVDRVTRMIDLAEYKRTQAATGLKITSVAFGPGRRVPIAQRWRPSAR